MWCLWALPLLGLAVRVSSEETPAVSCNGTSVIVQPPLWLRMYQDEAHFVCSSGYRLRGQSVLTCIHTNWDHPVPTCEKLPRVMIKMKCPFDHREWTLSNLNLISNWIDQNNDQVLILNSDYIEDSPESQRLAAEMLARFNDPFFRFYSKLPKTDKGMAMVRLIQRFQESEQFLQLRNKMRENFADFEFNDIDEDRNVLLHYYGIHFANVLEYIILPYNGLVTKQAETEELPDLKHALKPLKTAVLNAEPSHQFAKSSPSDSSEEKAVKEIPIERDQFDLPVSIEDHSGVQSSSEPAEGIVSSEQTLKKNTKRQKGDIDKLLPAETSGSDLFNRPLLQTLEGEKARQQTRMHRDSYIEYLKTIVKHIIDHNIPKDKWPDSLRKYDLEEISIVLGIPTPTIPVDPECPPPWRLGFELVANGTAMLQGTNRVVIKCNPGFQLRGSSELFCDRGRWAPRGAGMPTCVSSRRDQCDSVVPSVLNGRPIKVERNYVLYECLPGYANRGSNMLVCENGQWVPRVGDSMPVCREVQASNNCGPPPSPANGYAGEPHFMTDGQRFVVRYFCERNYSMEGDDYSMCVNGQWTPKTFRCVLGAVDNVPNNVEMPQTPRICPKLVVPNASVKYYEDGASTVRVTCPPGYRMIGAGLIRCENGIYVDPIPQCMDRTAQDSCGPAVAPLHGSVQYITQNAVRFSCDPGYTLRGRDRATCYLGQWSDSTPECLPKAGCDNNDQLLSKNLVGYVYNNGRWLECAERVEMIGQHHQYCRNGRWDVEPTCMMLDNAQKTSILYPEFIDCPLPEVSTSNGVTISSRGRKIYYRCKAQDSILRGERSNECVGGRWLHPAPYCERRGVYVPPTTAPAPFRGCSPRPIRGGKGYIYSEGRVIVYQCETRYLIRGQTTLRCERSQWSSPLPSCYDPGQSLIQEDGEIFSDSMSCPPPPYFPGTTATIMNRGLRVAFNCPNGNLTIQDCSDGRWSGGIPQCSSSPPTGVCEPQEIENGKFFQYRRGVGYIQCKGNYVIENTRDSRSQDVRCNPDNGRWSFGLNPPKCVPESGDIQDDRPFDGADDSKWDNRLQVDDCGPPEVSSNFTFYIQKDGRSIALGCKKPRSKRNVGTIECLKGSWSYSANDICDSNCGLDDVNIENGVKVVYDENEFVFQCLQNYDLLGAPVAHCADYQPDAVYNASFVQRFGPDFKAPECRRSEVELRPISGDDVLESDAFQPCRWLAEFGKLNLKPKDYFISDRGRVMTWRIDTKENTAICQNGMWVNKAAQTRGGCDNLPSEPEQGTFFLYEDSRGTSIYFQCFDGYRLSGPRVSICGGSRVFVPDCIPDASAPRGVYPKVKNPNPASSVRCSRPPEYVPNAEVTIYGSGDMFTINCNPGFSIENTRERYATIQCNQYVWYPENLPRCLRDGDRTPLPTIGTRRDLFGRRLPQDLTGEKAQRQDIQLREQFRQHAQQLVEFAKARNRELRQSGVPIERLPVERLPIVSTITDEERDQLFRTNEETYREIERLLETIREERIRARRQNHQQESVPGSDPPVTIPESLQHLDTLIKQNKLSQPDIDILAMLGETDRLKFLNEKKTQQEKSKSDPVRSQDFVRKAIAQRNKFTKKNSAEENQPTSVEVGNSIESLKTENPGSPSSSEISSTPATKEMTHPVTGSAAPTTTTTTAGPLASASESVTPNSVEVTEAVTTVTEDAVSLSLNESTVTEAASGSSGARKGFDDSCSQQFEKAPEIENGFVVSYEVFESKDGKALQAKYRCDEGYYFAFEHTNKLRCRNGEWIGELPSCVPEPDTEEDEDPEASDSQLNKLK